jgi:superfamily II DNA/RNA helicase
MKAFPERKTAELPYQLSQGYRDFYRAAREFARGLSQRGQQEERQNRQRMRYWAALALLRGVMSSPASGLQMLHNRQQKYQPNAEDAAALSEQPNPLLETGEQDNDTPFLEFLEESDLEKQEQDTLQELYKQLEQLKGPDQDLKLARAEKTVRMWLKEAYNPIVFCKYIETARYVGKHLKAVLPQDVGVEIVTSEMADEQRRETVEAMERHKKRVLVATDCLSEGINLQALFTAVLHYDLPWNPNRIEQREGRVDRFGQTAETVQTRLLYSPDNPVDENVYKILIEKVRRIHQSTGVAINLGEEQTALMERLLEDVLNAETDLPARQLQLYEEEEFEKNLEQARDKAQNLRNIFAHESDIQYQTIQTALQKVDEAIGDMATVEAFTTRALAEMGVEYKQDPKGYKLYTTNLPGELKYHFNNEHEVRISFDSPTPEGYRYLGRNHPFVEQLCQYVLKRAFARPSEKEARDPRELPDVGRCAMITSATVQRRTAVVVFRIRNVIQRRKNHHRVVAEEMYLWGYQADSTNGTQLSELSYDQCKDLLLHAQPAANLSLEYQQRELAQELQKLRQQEDRFTALAEERTQKLIDEHGQFKQAVGGYSYEMVTPVLPPDLMGLFLILPESQTHHNRS